MTFTSIGPPVPPSLLQMTEYIVDTLGLKVTVPDTSPKPSAGLISEVSKFIPTLEVEGGTGQSQLNSIGHPEQSTQDGPVHEHPSGSVHPGVRIETLTHTVSVTVTIVAACTSSNGLRKARTF